ncbi:hypothetical protein JTB14_014569 [Gonioctena quinquepunctata]|nr:hypothetical protein JTB14_014569 [Gonioctena quinquepunctata]
MYTCWMCAHPATQSLASNCYGDLLQEGRTRESECQEQSNAYLKELETLGEVFDVIIKTGVECDLNTKDFTNFLKTDGTVISTLPPVLTSDSYGVLRRFMLSFYIYLKYKLQNVLGLPKNDFDEAHLCYVTLDRLTQCVEDGYLQTVVDKIYQPHDIEIALNHIQSLHSIGSTVITFR